MEYSLIISKIDYEQLLPLFLTDFFGKRVIHFCNIRNFVVVFDFNMALFIHVSQLTKCTQTNINDLQRIHKLIDLNTSFLP